MPFETTGVAADFVSNSQVRVKLLEHLTKVPMTPTELASIERKHVSHVSRALAELRAQGLIEPLSNQARERKYRATYEGLAVCANLVKIPK